MARIGCRPPRENAVFKASIRDRVDRVPSVVPVDLDLIRISLIPGETVRDRGDDEKQFRIRTGGLHPEAAVLLISHRHGEKLISALTHDHHSPGKTRRRSRRARSVPGTSCLQSGIRDKLGESVRFWHNSPAQ